MFMLHMSPLQYSLLKTGRLPAQWAASSSGLTVSIPGGKYIIFVTDKEKKNVKNAQKETQ